MIEAAAASAIGNRRWNADAYLCDVDAWLFGVSDGKGDTQAAAETSARVIDAVREMFKPWSPPEQRTTREALGRLVQGVTEANVRTYDPRPLHGKERSIATFTGLVTVGDRFIRVHVGDTRCYHVAPAARRITQVTDDDTVMGEWVRSGEREELAAMKPNAHRILRAVGFGLWLDTTNRKHAWARDDLLLLCTKGVHRALAPKAIGAVLLEHRDLNVAAQTLVKLASEHVAARNATVVLVRHAGEPPSPLAQSIGAGAGPA